MPPGLAGQPGEQFAAGLIQPVSILDFQHQRACGAQGQQESANCTERVLVTQPGAIQLGVERTRPMQVEQRPQEGLRAQQFGPLHFRLGYSQQAFQARLEASAVFFGWRLRVLLEILLQNICKRVECLA